MSTLIESFHGMWAKLTGQADALVASAKAVWTANPLLISAVGALLLLAFVIFPLRMYLRGRAQERRNLRQTEDLLARLAATKAANTELEGQLAASGPGQSLADVHRRIAASVGQEGHEIKARLFGTEKRLGRRIDSQSDALAAQTADFTKGFGRISSDIELLKKEVGEIEGRLKDSVGGLLLPLCQGQSELLTRLETLEQALQNMQGDGASALERQLANAKGVLTPQFASRGAKSAGSNGGSASPTLGDRFTR